MENAFITIVFSGWTFYISALLYAKSHNTINLKLYNTMLKTCIEWVVGFIIGVVAPVAIYLQLVSGIVIADTIVGVLAANYRNESLTWKGLKPACIKIILFCTTLLVVFHFERTLFDGAEAAYVTKIVASIIAFVQIKSIDRNFANITGYSFWDTLNSKIGSIELPNRKKEDFTNEKN